MVHVLELNSQNNAFIVEIIPDDPMANVTIYGLGEGAPTLEKYNFQHSFEVNSTKYQRFLGNETINGVIKYYVGVKSGVQMNYTFKSYEIGCYYYDEGNKSWTTQGCTVCISSRFMFEVSLLPLLVLTPDMMIWAGADLGVVRLVTRLT